MWLKEPSTLFLVTKRVIDILLASIGLILTSPIFFIIFILYNFGDSKGNVFFKQLRYGKNGEQFYIYKFRSMVMDADKKLKNDPALYQKYIQQNYKLEPTEDPRLTKFGRFIRKTSMDELPQLINVLKGDMSIVGPRPIVEEELNEYAHQKNDFLSVKPGITGYWQINGRSNVGYPKRVDLELYYIYNQSFWLDLKILLKTFVVVFLRKGAY